MKPAITILAIAGSLREGSLNRRLVEASVDVAPESVRVIPFDLSGIPLYNGDLEAAGDPEPVLVFKRALVEADGLLIVTPEYNSGMPGVLKNALDWASRPPRPLVGLPLAVIGATPGRWGTLQAQLDVQRVARHIGMLPMPSPSLHVSEARQVFDPNGALVDPGTRDRLKAVVLGLEAWIQRVSVTAGVEAA